MDSRGEERLRDAAAALADTEAAPMVVVRRGDTDYGRGWVIKEWQAERSVDAIVLTTDGVALKVVRSPVTAENGLFRRLRYTIWDPPRHGPAPKRVVGHEWQHLYPYPADDPQAASAVRSYCAQRGISLDV